MPPDRDPGSGRSAPARPTRATVPSLLLSGVARMACRRLFGAAPLRSPSSSKGPPAPPVPAFIVEDTRDPHRCVSARGSRIRISRWPRAVGAASENHHEHHLETGRPRRVRRDPRRRVCRLRVRRERVSRPARPAQPPARQLSVALRRAQRARFLRHTRTPGTGPVGRPRSRGRSAPSTPFRSEPTASVPRPEPLSHWKPHASRDRRPVTRAAGRARWAPFVSSLRFSLRDRAGPGSRACHPTRPCAPRSETGRIARGTREKGRMPKHPPLTEHQISRITQLPPPDPVWSGWSLRCSRRPRPSRRGGRS